MKDIKSNGIRPYGQHQADGIVQISFTLQLPCNEEAQRVAVSYSAKMGLQNARVTWMEAIGPEFTYFILYGQAEHSVDLAEARALEGPLQRVAEKPTQLDKEYRQHLGRRVSLLVCTDGMDQCEIDFEALVSLKGVSGEIGLEGYSTFNIRRLRDVDSVDKITDAAMRMKADALIVCEPESGWGKGEKGLKDLAGKIKKAKELPEWFVAACWRRKPTAADTVLVGYDLSFSSGVLPSTVADSLVATLHQKGLSSDRGDKREAGDEAPRKKRRLWGLLGREK